MDAGRRRRVAYRSGLTRTQKAFSCGSRCRRNSRTAQAKAITCLRTKWPRRSPRGSSWAPTVAPRARLPLLQRINYLDVQLAAGERWTYQPPLDHEVAWLAVSEGTIRTPEPVSAGEFVAFEESSEAPCPFRRTVRRDSFSVPRPNTRTTWYSVITRFTRLRRLSSRVRPRFNASAINSWPLDCSASTQT